MTDQTFCSARGACVLECGGCDAALKSIPPAFVRPKSLRHARACWTHAKLNLGKLRLFQEKKDCLFFLSRRLVSSKSDEDGSLGEAGFGQANLKPKSTIAPPKSTVDLRLEPLICGKNGLPRLLLPANHDPFSPITTRQLERANQKPTKANRKMTRCAILFELASNPLVKEYRLDYC